MSLRDASDLVADHVEMPVVLRIELPVAANRSGRVGRADGKLLEDFLLQRAVRIDGEEIAVFAIGVGDTVRVNRRRIDAPLKARRVIAHTSHRAVWLACATQRVGVLVLPLNS